MVCSRSAGSSTSVASVQMAPPTMLPASASSSSRMFTGAIATNGRSGNAPCSAEVLAHGACAHRERDVVDRDFGLRRDFRYPSQRPGAHGTATRAAFAVPKIVLGARRAGASSRFRYSSRINEIERRNSRAVWTNLPVDCGVGCRFGRLGSDRVRAAAPMTPAHCVSPDRGSAPPESHWRPTYRRRARGVP